MDSFPILPGLNRKADNPVGLAKTKWKDGRCCWTERGRNERIVVSAKRDGKRHGPAVNQTVAARALGWRSEVSVGNRTHGPARCEYGSESGNFAMLLVPVKVPVHG